MHARLTHSLLIVAAVSLAWVGAPPVFGQDHDHDGQHEAGEHAHSAAAKLVNPVKPTPESIAAGGKIFQERCANCHGPAGLGDGRDGARMDPKPANLTDATWKHGSTDGEIFTVIRDGAKANGKAAMPSFGSKLSATELWNTVNYVRSLSANAK
jgi:mono/diheme cytochrome c family protein